MSGYLINECLIEGRVQYLAGPVTDEPVLTVLVELAGEVVAGEPSGVQERGGTEDE